MGKSAYCAKQGLNVSSFSNWTTRFQREASGNSTLAEELTFFKVDTQSGLTSLEDWLRPALVEFQGVIVSNEHGAYDILARNYPRIQAHGGCLAHARRKFTAFLTHHGIARENPIKPELSGLH